MDSKRVSTPGGTPSRSADSCEPNHLIATPSDLSGVQIRNVNGEEVNVKSDEKLAVPLSSESALAKLHDEINREIKLMQNEFSKRSLWSWLNESISFKSELSKMRWPSVLFMVGHVMAHFIVAFVLRVDRLATSWMGFQGLLLFLLLLFNLIVNLWDNQLRYKELLMKSEQISDLIKRCSQDKHLISKWKQFSWKSASARTLFVPKSPCVHQTLTYRDSSCLNLPDFLLVTGDIIHLYPGERAPGDCVSLRLVNNSCNTKELEQDFGRITLKDGELFHPINHHSKKHHSEQDSHPCNNLPGSPDCSSNIARDAAKLSNHAYLKRARLGKDFLMLSTPYIKSLKISLQRSHKRPVNSIEKECFIVSRKYFETYVIPLVFVLSTLVTGIHYAYLDLSDEDHQIKTISIAYLLMRPSLTIMPFLPWMFPCFWMIINAYGSARLLCCAEAQRTRIKQQRRAATKELDSQLDHDEEDGASTTGESGPARANRLRPAGRGHSNIGADSEAFGNLLATPTAPDGSDHNKQDESELHELQNKVKFGQIFEMFLALVMGRSGHVWRSSSLLQVLGCLTSLCCIDKVGILSWSNPTPEKVFLLTKGESSRATESASSGGGGDHSDDSHNHHSNERHLIDGPRDDGALRAPMMQSSLLDKHCEHASQRASFTDQSVGLAAAGQCVDDLFDAHQFGANLNSSAGANTPISLRSKFAASQQRAHSSAPRVEVLDVSQAFSAYRGYCDQVPKERASQLQFDDPNWTRFQANLKPLGLSILLNSCCAQSFGDYFRFYKHISYESILRCNLTPVVKRRCLCALAELIGFSSATIKSYNYLNQIGCYKLIDPNAMIKRGKLVSSDLERSARLKLPFPNMTCNSQQDSSTGSYQLFSQGTADILLDFCVEYWDGREIRSLDEVSRKKIMDFYHRTSLTAYCCAFAYSPLLKSHNLSEYYVELPMETSLFRSGLRKLAHEEDEQHLAKRLVSAYPQSGPCSLRTVSLALDDKSVRSDGPHATVQHKLGHHQDENSNLTCDQGEFDLAPLACGPSMMVPRISLTFEDESNQQVSSDSRLMKLRPRRHLSADELPDDRLIGVQDCSSKIREEEPMLAAKPDDKDVDGNDWLESSALEARPRSTKRNKMNKRLAEAIEDVSEQVFVGMVAMQYQCCTDFVALIEQLEHACIRFVHFSKENELRSRVFSEKMGLESGWNCHISLRSDQDLDEADRSAAVGEPKFIANSSRETSKDSSQLILSSFKPTPRVSNILSSGFKSAKSSMSRDHLIASEQLSATGLEQNEKAHNQQLLDEQLSESRSPSTGANLISTDLITLHSWRSLPSLIMRIISKTNQHEAKHSSKSAHVETLTGFQSAEPRQVADERVELMGSQVVGANESADTDCGPSVIVRATEEEQQQQQNDEEARQQFESLAFDMSNRAKLPKGIENIRPHLEQVDNIPLQVSLFTDCTPELTKEMIEIMQDYGEIVCVIGSASSRMNTSIFLQANASVAIEPLVPQSCTQAAKTRRHLGCEQSQVLGEFARKSGRRATAGKRARRPRAPVSGRVRVEQRQGGFGRGPLAGARRSRARVDKARAEAEKVQETPRLAQARRDRLGITQQVGLAAGLSSCAPASNKRMSLMRRLRLSRRSVSDCSVTKQAVNYDKTSSGESSQHSSYASLSNASSSSSSSSSHRTSSSRSGSSRDSRSSASASSRANSRSRANSSKTCSSSASSSSSSSSSSSTTASSRSSSRSASLRASSPYCSSSSFSSQSSSDCWTLEHEQSNQASELLMGDQGANCAFVCKPNDGHECSQLAQDLPEPTALASRLVSLPCSYSYNRAEPVNLYSLIMEARHFTFKMKNTFVCMMCFALSISSAQFLTSILFLPPMLSSGLTIWLTLIVVPLMSFSLMDTKMDSQVMKIAVGKNLQLKPENITFFVICYLIKFIPSIIVVVLNFGLIIAHSCKLTGFGSSSLGPCWMFTYVRHSNLGAIASTGSSGAPVAQSINVSVSSETSATIDGDLLWSNHLLTAQVCAAFLIVLYFVVISSGFVHRSHLMWQRNPLKNRLWLAVSVTLIIGQLFYNQLVLRVNLSSSRIPFEFLKSLPLHIWLISFSWPILLIGVNLLVKRAEIKATIRQQRRARFDFNTKLGMNSPF